MQFAFEADLLTKSEVRYLENYNFPTFYIIPKIHKDETNPSGRPIVPAMKFQMERVGKYIVSLIKELVCDLPSYVRGMGDVLNKTMNGAFPGDVLLVGIDVESLYKSTPHEWGIAAVFHFLDEKFPRMRAQNEFVIELLELALLSILRLFLPTDKQHLDGCPLGAGICLSALRMVGGGDCLCLSDVPWPHSFVAKVH